MNERGINSGTSGNVSVRVPDDLGGGMVITPSGRAYEALEPADLIHLAPDTSWSTVGDDRDPGLRPSSEWRFHLDILAARPDAEAVVHAHPTAATALAIHGQGIGPVHYMVGIAGGHDIRCAPYATFGTPELSANAVDRPRWSEGLPPGPPRDHRHRVRPRSGHRGGGRGRGPGRPVPGRPGHRTTTGADGRADGCGPGQDGLARRLRLQPWCELSGRPATIVAPMRTLDWVDGVIELVDQTKLPQEIEILRIDNVADLVGAIKRLSVRGAPALGVAGGYGVALAAALHPPQTDPDGFEAAVQSIRDARPTAVNLARMVDRVVPIAPPGPGPGPGRGRHHP